MKVVRKNYFTEFIIVITILLSNFLMATRFIVVTDRCRLEIAVAVES